MIKAAVALRPMLPDDGPMLARIFVSSIEELTGDDYSPAQQAAWSAAADDEAAFASRMSGFLTLIASVAERPVGFASLRGNDHVEMLFVHPDAAGQGVAATLCDALERLAKARGAARLSVHASDTAEGFFRKRGYEPKQRETVARGEVWLGRTLMTKTLDAARLPDRP